MSPSGERLAARFLDPLAQKTEIIVYTTADGRARTRFASQGGGPLAFAGEERLIAQASSEFLLYDVRGGQPLAALAYPWCYDSHLNRLYAPKSSGTPRRLCVWDATSGGQIAEWPCECVGIAVDSSSGRVATCHYEKLVHFWSADGREMLKLPLPENPNDLEFSPSGTYLVIRYSDTIQIYSFAAP